jgi:Domain of unknown function (DUF1877)
VVRAATPNLANSGESEDHRASTMSMIGTFRRVESARVASLASDPESVQEYLESDEDADGDDEDTDARAEIDVDKAWHGIHFLLTGTAWEGEPPLGFIVRGGRELGEVGYGPARLFSNDEVKAIAASLRPLTREVLEARFQPDTMMRLEIYPNIWDRPRDEDDTLEYLLSYYDSLREFVTGAAELGEGLIVYVT